MVRVNSVVVGLGEVGSAVRDVLSEKYAVHGVDIATEITFDECEYLNICIPYSDRFVEIVNNYVDKFKPILTVIHSTVLPGITRKINGQAVFSPIRGRHQEGLEYGLKTYVKYIGYNGEEEGELAKKYLGKVFLKTKIIENTNKTELMKILCLLRYGLHLEIADLMNDICKDYKFDYKTIVKEWDGNYNEGIKRKHLEMQRPIYDPPNNRIGGHCVIPVVRLFAKNYRSEYIDRFLDRYG